MRWQMELAAGESRDIRPGFVVSHPKGEPPVGQVNTVRNTHRPQGRRRRLPARYCGRRRLGSTLRGYQPECLTGHCGPGVFAAALAPL
jgi:hypothetical protein